MMPPMFNKVRLHRKIREFYGRRGTNFEVVERGQSDKHANED